MPFFKIECTKSSKSVMIKAESTDEILKKSIEKLKLPDKYYSVVLEDKKTEVDDDVFEYATQSSTLMKLFIVTEDTCTEDIEKTNNGEGKYKNIFLFLKLN